MDIPNLLLSLHKQNDITMEWITSQPEKEGKYVVKTITPLLKKEHVMIADFNIDEKGNTNWSFKNQNFKAYLKEN